VCCKGATNAPSERRSRLSRPGSPSHPLGFRHSPTAPRDESARSPHGPQASDCRGVSLPSAPHSLRLATRLVVSDSCVVALAGGPGGSVSSASQGAHMGGPPMGVLGAETRTMRPGLSTARSDIPSHADAGVGLRQGGLSGQRG
jgi:hypothetical protein